MRKVAAIITRHWKWLLGLNLFVLGATAAVVATSPRVWTANTKLILPNATSHIDANLGTLGSFKNGDTDFSSTQVNPLKVQASILTSDALLERVRTADPEKDKFPRLVSYAQLFNVSPQEQSTIVSLAVNGSSPELARSRALALIQAYQQRLNELRQANSAAREQYSQKELEIRSTLIALPALQGRLLELQRTYNVAEGIYKGLIAQIKQSNIDAFDAYPNVQVLDAPTVDSKPSSPKNSLAALNAQLVALAINGMETPARPYSYRSNGSLVAS